jgi:hypothetical protein
VTPITIATNKPGKPIKVGVRPAGACRLGRRWRV